MAREVVVASAASAAGGSDCVGCPARAVYDTIRKRYVSRVVRIIFEHNAEYVRVLTCECNTY